MNITYHLDSPNKLGYCATVMHAQLAHGLQFRSRELQLGVDDVLNPYSTTATN